MTLLRTADLVLAEIAGADGEALAMSRRALELDLLGGDRRLRLGLVPCPSLRRSYSGLKKRGGSAPGRCIRLSLVKMATTRPAWFCAIETERSAADLFAMNTVLMVFLFTVAPALCVAQPDSARDLDFDPACVSHA